MKNLYQHIPFLIIFLMGINTVQGQDPHFSINQFNPIYLNPALTGVIPDGGNDRLSLQYRNQWGSILKDQAFQTSMVTYDRRWCSQNYNEFFSLGISLLNDEVGAANFRTQSAHLKGAYLRQFFGGAHISLGGEIGVIRYQIGNEDLRFDAQYDGFGGFDASRISQEDFNSLSTNLLDLGVGLLIYKQFGRSDQQLLSGGITFHHLTKPNYSFLSSNFDADSELRMLQKVHISYQNRANGIAGLSAHVLYQRQRPYSQFNARVNLDLFMGSIQAYRLSFGPGIRLNRKVDSDFIQHIDALIIHTGFNAGRFSINAAYDLNLSRLNAATNGVGALELSLQFLLNKNTDRNCKIIFCPDF